jgi:hypothetical protein
LPWAASTSSRLEQPRARIMPLPNIAPPMAAPDRLPRAASCLPELRARRDAWMRTRPELVAQIEGLAEAVSGRRGALWGTLGDQQAPLPTMPIELARGRVRVLKADEAQREAIVEAEREAHRAAERRKGWWVIFGIAAVPILSTWGMVALGLIGEPERPTQQAELPVAGDRTGDEGDGLRVEAAGQRAPAPSATTAGTRPPLAQPRADEASPSPPARDKRDDPLSTKSLQEFGRGLAGVLVLALLIMSRNRRSGATPPPARPPPPPPPLPGIEPMVSTWCREHGVFPHQLALALGADGRPIDPLLLDPLTDLECMGIAHIRRAYRWGSR